MYKKSDRKGFANNIANLPWLTKMDSVIKNLSSFTSHKKNSESMEF